MRDVTHFDAIVVGSGFGGSVTAYRLAEAGQRVCVLERGKAYPPGSFPRDPRGMARNFWDPSRGLHGLFNIWSFDGTEAVVSSGLGGGSLIYANVLIRKDERWFVDEHPYDGTSWRWPVDRTDLDPHYDAVEKMLGATPFPFGAQGYATPKTGAMREAAQRLDLDWHLPDLAVTFANEGAPPRPREPISEGAYPNLHGRTRLTCRMCGECDIGCNDGAKNTLDHTYLSAAAHHGAEIRTRCEVRRIAPRREGGFRVGYVEHVADAEGQPTRTSKLPVHELTAERLILAAGALGTTYLLLRNQSAFPRLGPAIGTRFCGNGDLLGFMSGVRHHDGRDRPLDASSAPVITSTIRFPDARDGGTGRGFYIQDAGYPGFADWMVEAANAPRTIQRTLRFLVQRLWARLRRDPRSDLSAAIAGLLGDGMRSSATMPLLGMGRDTPDGVMSLRRGYLAVDWTMESSAAYFTRVRETMRNIADALGGRFDDNPTYALKRVITVHPLGGAPMGHHIDEGVVDAYGQSFAYPGLYVVDGAAMPGPVGPNPALTIAAFADRASDHLLSGPTSRERRSDHVSASPAVPVAASNSSLAASSGVDQSPAGAHGQTSVWFTEEMKGYLAIGERDPVIGYEIGERDDRTLMFRLTIRMDDIDAFVTDPHHEGSATGWIEGDGLGGRFEVERGVFNLFVSGDDPSRRTMLYRLPFTDAAGDAVTLSGFKDVHDDPGFDVWTDTSTLYVRLYRGHVGAEEEPATEIIAAGILHIHKADFARQLTTFRAAGASPAARASGLAKFGRLFLGELWDIYGTEQSGAAR